jgi:hypothetical protein
VLRLLRWKGEAAEEVNQVATQLAKFKDADDLEIEKHVAERARRAASYSHDGAVDLLRMTASPHHSIHPPTYVERAFM